MARDWGQFALLLIDVQRDFWSDKMQQDFPGFPANVARLLELCRGEGLDVVHLRACFKPDMSDWMVRYRLRGHVPCVEGTAGVETLPFAVEAPGEVVLVKRTFDGFHNPDLLSHLLGKGKRFLLVGGLLTSVCVFLTAASAAQLGFLVAVVEDCCADDGLAHAHTFERYHFIFDCTTTTALCDDHSRWLAELQELAA
jgi:nicotinamidase-related amidase